METICEHCEAACKAPWHGFQAQCLGCAARAAARGPNFRASRSAGNQTRAYREELQLLGVTHAQVLEAAAQDKIGDER